MKKRSLGFTLAELLIVIAIISVLAAVSIPVILGAKKKSEEAACLQNRSSLFDALQIARMTDSNATDDELVKAAAASLGKNVTGTDQIEGLCPDGGVYTITFTDPDIVTVKCSVHGGNAESFADDLMNTVFANLTKITRSGKTLKAYLAQGGKTVDSAVASSEETWTSLITAELKKTNAVLADKGWALTYDTSKKQYVMVMTTGDSSTLTSSSSVGKMIGVVEYVYDENGKLVSQTTGTAKVNHYTKGTPNYNRIDINSFTE